MGKMVKILVGRICVCMESVLVVEHTWLHQERRTQIDIFEWNFFCCSVSISASNSKMFVSGSCDMTAKLWDTRTSSCVRTFHGHDGDVNTVQFLPDGLHFGTGSDDGSCRLFDTRTGHELQQYRNSSSTHAITGPANNVTSIAFSYSGRLLFAGYSNGNCYAWDTLLAEVTMAVTFCY